MANETPRPAVDLTPEEIRFLEAIRGGATVEKAARKAKRSRRWAYYALNRCRRIMLAPARAS